MSWEHENITEKRPCGNGVYTYTSSSNDWGQSNSDNYVMHCQKCKENYVLTFSSYAHATGKSDGWYWQKREDYERVQERRRLKKEAALQRRATIPPPTVEMPKKEIIAMIEKECRNCSFNRSANKAELVRVYHHWTDYIDNNPEH